MSGLRRKLNRMAQAGPRQAARMVWSRTVRKIAPPPAMPNGRAAVDAITGSGADWMERLVLGAPMDAAPRSTARLCQTQFPEAVAETIAAADRIVEGRFHFLGRDVHFNGPVDWHWCPESGSSWPRDGAELPSGFYTAESRPGDVKYPWELNRHQYFITLAQAFLYTDDARYIDTLTRHVVEWRAKNPVGHGLNWHSAMELGIRIISWATAFFLLKDEPLFRKEAARHFVEGLYEHAGVLSQRLSVDWLIPSNHIIGETAGLWVFAVLFPGFRESARWEARAIRIFAKEIAGQIAEDGVNLEQTTGYHRFVLDFLGLVVELAERNGKSIPPVLRDRYDAMCAYEAHLVAAGNPVPQIGDCDDGRGVAMSCLAEPYDFRGWIAGPDDGATDETLWLFGAAAWEEGLGGTESEAPVSKHYPTGGQAILCAGSGVEGASAFLRCGTFGLGGDGACSHSHADLLAIVAAYRGRPLFIDAGTYGYLCEREKREALRATGAHNTAAPIDGEQARAFPYWDWDRVPSARVLAFSDDRDSPRIEAAMTAGGMYRHRRVVALSRSPLTITVDDTVDSDKGGAAWESRFLLAPELIAVSEGPGQIEIRRRLPEGGDAPWCRILYEGYESCTIEEAPFSPRYGVWDTTQRIRLTAERSGTTGRIAVVPAP